MQPLRWRSDIGDRCEKEFKKTCVAITTELNSDKASLSQGCQHSATHRVASIDSITPRH